MGRSGCLFWLFFLETHREHWVPTPGTGDFRFSLPVLIDLQLSWGEGGNTHLGAAGLTRRWGLTEATHRSLLCVTLREQQPLWGGICKAVAAGAPSGVSQGEQDSRAQRPSQLGAVSLQMP